MIPRILPSGLESIGVGLGIGGKPLQNIGQIASMYQVTIFDACLTSFICSWFGFLKRTCYIFIVRREATFDVCFTSRCFGIAQG